MRIGVLRVYFQIPDAQSLKEKRRVVRSIKDRLFAQFNVAVAEIGSNDVIGAGELGVVTCGNEKRYVEGIMQKALNWIDERAEGIVVIESDIEIL